MRIFVVEMEQDLEELMWKFDAASVALNRFYELVNKLENNENSTYYRLKRKKG